MIKEKIKPMIESSIAERFADLFDDIEHHYGLEAIWFKINLQYKDGDGFTLWSESAAEERDELQSMDDEKPTESRHF